MEYQKIDIDKIKLDFDNPRIKHWLEMYPGKITSEHIALALTSPSGSNSSSSYSALKESIRVNKGIITPIVVNHTKNDDFIVIEGNTRLQIYKEFYQNDPNGPWGQILCAVYDDLPTDEIHAIRLQTHLVGPRDWDPFSKAKYLNQLYNIDKMPMNQIISYCGGKKNEIEKLIYAYNDMMRFYCDIVRDNGDDPDPKEFSKFAELQNRSITDSLRKHNYTKTDFAKWVINGNIDNAQNVRKLPAILDNKRASEEFKKTNISNAIKYVDIDEKSAKILETVSLNDLVLATDSKIRTIQYADLKELRENDEQKNNLLNLLDNLKGFIEDLD